MCSYSLFNLHVSLLVLILSLMLRGFDWLFKNIRAYCMRLCPDQVQDNNILKIEKGYIIHSMTLLFNEPGAGWRSGYTWVARRNGEVSGSRPGEVKLAGSGDVASRPAEAGCGVNSFVIFFFFFWGNRKGCRPFYE